MRRVKKHNAQQSKDRWVDFGKHIEHFRLKYTKLTQERVAEAVGVSERHWKRYIKGAPVPHKRILKIAKVMGMPVGKTLLHAGFEPKKPGVEVKTYLRLIRDSVFEGQMHEALFNLYEFYYDANKEEKLFKLMADSTLANDFMAVAVAINRMPGWLRREFIVYLGAIEKGGSNREDLVAPELWENTRAMIAKNLPKALRQNGMLPWSGDGKNEEVENGVHHPGHDSSEESTGDQAALPLHFEPRLIELRIDKAAMNEAQANVPIRTSEAEQADIARRVPQMAALVKAPERIRIIVEDLVEHYREKVEPNGFKAMIVPFDRESCVLYKQELDRIMPPEASDIVMTVWQGDPLEWKQRYRRGKTDQEPLLERYRDPADPLKILIVTSKLLWDFDAPIMQAMYLDKPLTERHYLQAVRRTDRPHPNKTQGLIVDYLGLLDRMLRSFSLDDAVLRRVFSNLDELKKPSPSGVPVEGVSETFGTLVTDANSLQDILAKGEPEKLREMDALIRARLHLHQNNPDFIAFGRQLEELKERHRQGVISSSEFLKHMLDLAQTVNVAERKIGPREAQEQARADMTELFNEVRGSEAPTLVERIVKEIDANVRHNRFPNWQLDMNGEHEIHRTLRNVLRDYNLHHEHELSSRIYDYLKQYY
jgi:transcriptional regulator with XRE-family HTH domain